MQQPNAAVRLFTSKPRGLCKARITVPLTVHIMLLAPISSVPAVHAFVYPKYVRAF